SALLASCAARRPLSVFACGSAGGACGIGAGGFGAVVVGAAAGIRTRTPPTTSPLELVTSWLTKTSMRWPRQASVSSPYAAMSTRRFVTFRTIGLSPVPAKCRTGLSSRGFCRVSILTSAIVARIGAGTSPLVRYLLLPFELIFMFISFEVRVARLVFGHGGLMRGVKMCQSERRRLRRRRARRRRLPVGPARPRQHRG